jgi:hypothetical protein
VESCRGYDMRYAMRPAQSPAPTQPPLSRGALVAHVAAAPLLLTMLGVELVRIAAALGGAPLLITDLFGLHIDVRWSAGPVRLLLGLSLHAAIILLVLVLLWGQLGIFKLWLRTKRKRT